VGNQRGHELADHITRIVALLADELSTSDAAKESSRSDVTHALSTARSLQALADEALAHLVTDARNRVESRGRPSAMPWAFRGRLPSSGLAPRLTLGQEKR
jgi:hypothetical protein